MVWPQEAPRPEHPTAEAVEEYEPHPDEAEIRPAEPPTDAPSSPVAPPAWAPEEPIAALPEESFEPYPYEAEVYPAELPPDERPNPIAPIEAREVSPEPRLAEPWPEPVLEPESPVVGEAVTPPEPSPSVDIKVLLTEFETFGATPEFSILREKLGAPPDGLFGFARTYPRLILALLNRRFAGTGEQENLTAKVAFGAYFITDPRNNMPWRSPFKAEQASEEAVLRQESVRLTALREQLIENLTEGKRLFVYTGPITDEDLAAIRTAMRTYGENTLLHIVPADDANPAQHVEWQGAGLLRGYISRYGHGGAMWDVVLEDWVAICRTAHSLWKSPGPL